MRGLIGRFQDEPRLRQRAAALAGASVFFAGGLIVAGLGRLVIVAAVLAVLGGVLALLPRASVRETLQRVLRSAWSEQAREHWSTLSTGTVTSVKRHGAYLVRRASAVASTAEARGRQAWTGRERQAVATPVLPPAAGELYGWPYAGSVEVDPPRPTEPDVDEERRRAVELNKHGTELRRSGRPAAAAELHLEALEIVQSLHDDRAQAKTLNSLALALAANGETDSAVERFEESLSILRERPDDPGEGEVIANLGFTLLRQGDDEHARELLSEALEKLPPESRAAHKVEAELRRAS
jgi:tetratricopeptide (TPR) repeat protein